MMSNTEQLVDNGICNTNRSSPTLPAPLGQHTDQLYNEWQEQYFSPTCTPLPTEEEMAQPFKLDPLFEFDAPKYYDFEDTNAYSNTIYAVTTFNLLTGEIRVSYARLDDPTWFEIVHRDHEQSYEPSATNDNHLQEEKLRCSHWRANALAITTNCDDTISSRSFSDQETFAKVNEHAEWFPSTGSSELCSPEWCSLSSSYQDLKQSSINSSSNSSSLTTTTTIATSNLSTTPIRSVTPSPSPSRRSPLTPLSRKALGAPLRITVTSNQPSSQTSSPQALSSTPTTVRSSKNRRSLSSPLCSQVTLTNQSGTATLFTSPSIIASTTASNSSPVSLPQVNTPTPTKARRNAPHFVSAVTSFPNNECSTISSFSPSIPINGGATRSSMSPDTLLSDPVHASSPSLSSPRMHPLAEVSHQSTSVTQQNRTWPPAQLQTQPQSLHTQLFQSLQAQAQQPPQMFCVIHSSLATAKDDKQTTRRDIQKREAVKRVEKVIRRPQKSRKIGNKDENERLLDHVVKMLKRHNTHLQRQAIYAHRKHPGPRKPTVSQVRHIAATSLENYRSKQQHQQETRLRAL